MSTSEVELTIERIVLHDLPAVPSHRLVSAIEDALQRLLADHSLPAELATAPISLPATTVEVMPGASIETLAGQIARSILSSLPAKTNGMPSSAALLDAQSSGLRQPSQPTGRDQE